jgi:hypothetical protein
MLKVLYRDFLNKYAEKGLPAWILIERLDQPVGRNKR